MNFFRDSKIRTRLLVNSVLLFVLFLLAVLTYQQALSRMEHTFLNVLDEEHNVADQAVEIKAMMMEVRKAEKDFLLSKEIRYADRVREIIKQIQAKCGEIEAFVVNSGDEELAALAGSITENAGNYDATFQRVLAGHLRMGLDENSGLQGTFRKAAHELANAHLQEHSVGDLLQALEEMESEEESIIVKHRDADSDGLQEALENFSEKLQMKNMRAVAAEPLQQNLLLYEEAWGQFQAATDGAGKNRAATAMRDARLKMQELLENIYVPEVKGLALEIRRREKDFLLRRDELYVDLAHKAIDKLRAAIKGSAMNLEDLEGTLQYIDIYQENFDALVAEERTIDRLHGNLQEASLQVEQAVESIVAKTKLTAQKNTVRALDFSRSGVRIAIGICLAALLIGILFSLFITKSILNPLRAVLNGLTELRGGDYTARIPCRQDDETETGILARMFNKMAEAISENNWLSQGRNELAEQLRGEKEEQTLCRDIIAFLARYLNAQVGALYVAGEDGELRLCGSYAFESGKQPPEAIRATDGLVGEAATGKQIICLADVPEDYLRIGSSLGSTRARNIVAVPAMWQQQTLAVVELAALQSFTEEHMEFLRQTAESIAIALNSCRQRDKTLSLLAETQRQAEELQAQQEELKSFNEELEEQTQVLRQNEEELKSQQEELQAANEEMEEKNELLVQQKQEIMQKARDLEAASRYKSEFLANMSHELRTPLNSLLLLARNLSRNKDGNLDAGQVESATIIYNSGKDLLRLINDILDLSKIEAGHMEVATEQINFESFGNWLHNNFQHMAAEKGIGFEVCIDADLPEAITSDRQRLEQILRNLIANAIKFTDQGEIQVSFSKAKRAEAGRKGETLAIAVNDTGIGISPADQRIIFEAFKQADGGTARKYGGTGLGLSISQKLAILLGGEITLDSEEGKGSTFTLLLPIKHTAAPPKPEAGRKTEEQQPVAEPAAATELPVDIADDRHLLHPDDKSILIIEDDIHFARILMDLGHEKGFKCLASATGGKGLALAEKYRPSAIILDIRLPDTDGWGVLEALKQNPSLRHIPVHMMSAEEKNIEAFRKGAIGFLTKPVSEEELQEAFVRLQDAVSRRMRDLLVVEDDEILQREIMQLIGNGDVTTTPAASGAEVLSLLQQKKFDCMILDIGLPDMSGFTLLEELEKLEDIEIPPVIIYTGRDLTREEGKSLSRFTDTVIIKGVKSEERLLDETALFLHRVIGDLPRDKRQMIASLYEQDSMFRDKRILVVDDDMRNAFALSRILEEKGMQIAIANNGLHALELLDQSPDFDLVLMDIMMPELDGCETMLKIRSMREFREMPIIALTAKAMAEDREKCMAAGASDYLAKPVDEGRLLSMMRVWLYR